MPDSKITALTALTSADPAVDMFPVVDVSDTSMAASGTTKRISINNILACSPTATLASATITGDLTVDTNTLKVDSANNRVGIRTASPTEPLTVDNSSGVTTGAIRIYAIDQSHSRLSIQNGNGQAYHLVAGNPGASNAGFALYDNTGAATRWYVDNTGVHTWQNVGGVAGTAMTLNSTGLGIGVTPSAWPAASKAIDVDSYGANYAIAAATQVGISRNCYYNGTNWIYKLTTSAQRFEQDNGGGFKWFTAPSGTAGNAITGANAFVQAMTLDASGNLLVGKTASSTSVAGSQVQPDGTFSAVKADANPGLFYNTTTAISGTVALFRSNGVTVGSISQDGTNTAYNLSSDYRLKEQVQPLVGGLARVNSLKPSIYKWKTNGSNGEGFLAHELAEVVPFAVTGQKDAMNEDGTINPQGVDLSKIVPILVAAIQELTARVQTLEAK